MSNRPGNTAKDTPIIHIGSLPERSWSRHAACRGYDPNLWFVDDRTGSYREARQICSGCPVRRPCLAWALETHTNHGLWGGLAPLERKRLRRWGVQLDLADGEHVRVDDVRVSGGVL